MRINWQQTCENVLETMKQNASLRDKQSLNGVIIDLSKSLPTLFPDPYLRGQFVSILLQDMRKLQNIDLRSISDLLNTSAMQNNPIDFGKIESYIGNPITIASITMKL